MRDKLRNANHNKPDDETTQDQHKLFNHDNYIGKNFWGYVKNVLDKKQSSLPSFPMPDICLNYFKKALRSLNPNKLFYVPCWIPKLSDPVVNFDLQPPTTVNRNRMVWIAGKLQKGAANMSCIKGKKIT